VGYIITAMQIHIPDNWNSAIPKTTNHGWTIHGMDDDTSEAFHHQMIELTLPETVCHDQVHPHCRRRRIHRHCSPLSHRTCCLTVD